MNSAMIRDFAQSFLASSFWDEWEYLIDAEGADEMSISETEWEMLKRKYRDRQELSETIAPMFSYYNVDLNNFLLIQFVEEIVKAINEHWKRPNEEFSVEQLYTRYPHAAWSCVAGRTGMGIAATDDQEVKELFEVLEISEPSFYRESPSVWDAVAAMQQAIIAKRSEEIYFSESIGTRLCQWHNGMDEIYVVGSNAIANHPVPPNVVRDVVDLLERDLIQVRTNNPHDENIEELMDLIEELRFVLPEQSLPLAVPSR